MVCVRACVCANSTLTCTLHTEPSTCTCTQACTHTHSHTQELTVVLSAQYLWSNVVWSATESACCVPGPQSLLRGGGAEV